MGQRHRLGIPRAVVPESGWASDTSCHHRLGSLWTRAMELSFYKQPYSTPTLLFFLSECRTEILD